MRGKKAAETAGCDGMIFSEQDDMCSVLCQMHRPHELSADTRDATQECAPISTIIQWNELAQHIRNCTTIRYSPGTCFIGCLIDSSALWKKHLLYETLAEWCVRRKTSIRQFVPRTVVLDVAAESNTVAMKQLEHWQSHHRVEAFICKHSTGANGNTIRVTQSINDALDYIHNVKRKKKDSSRSEWWVIQEFVRDSPLVYGQRRFHVRMHTLLVYTPSGVNLYSYKTWRAQICTEKFCQDSYLENPNATISNWAFQKQNAGRFNTKTFYHYLDDMIRDYPQLKSFRSEAHRIIVKVVHAALTGDCARLQGQPGCFELFGFDFLVEQRDEDSLISKNTVTALSDKHSVSNQEDEVAVLNAVRGDQCNEEYESKSRAVETKWHPLLLEVNHRPGYAANKRAMEDMITSMIAFVMQPMYPSAHGDTERDSWEWIHTFWDLSQAHSHSSAIASASN